MQNILKVAIIYNSVIFSFLKFLPNFGTPLLNKLLKYFNFSSSIIVLTEKWKKFFCDAGIPLSEASTYAYKFAHNRIQTNMLADLNKDYLKEMGITILGDVIAILRHSKQVYEEV